MGPVVHVGVTAGLLAAANLAGYNVNYEIAGAAVLGGVLIDCDKGLEIIDNRRRRKKGSVPDITAEYRILHSILAWPCGLALSWFVFSWIPLLAVLLHALTDSAIPGLEKDGKDYSSHSPRKWFAVPFVEDSWGRVAIGWPVTYPPKLNWVYKKLAPAISGTLFLASLIYWFLK